MKTKTIIRVATRTGMLVCMYGMVATVAAVFRVYHCINTKKKVKQKKSGALVCSRGFI